MKLCFITLVRESDGEGGRGRGERDAYLSFLAGGCTSPALTVAFAWFSLSSYAPLVIFFATVLVDSLDLFDSLTAGAFRFSGSLASLFVLSDSTFVVNVVVVVLGATVDLVAARVVGMVGLVEVVDLAEMIVVEGALIAWMVALTELVAALDVDFIVGFVGST
jgi:hypothetical protein